MLVKKYSNRRLYDTQKSRYITLDELAESIRDGADVQVIDAKSGDDLTQQTLAQIVLESRGASKLLPVPLLTQMVRMGDDALAEFLGQTLSWSLQAYMQAKEQAKAFGGFGPFTPPFPTGAPFTPPMPFGSWYGAQGGQQPTEQPPSSSAPQAPPTPPETDEPSVVEEPAKQSDIDALRRELAELRHSLGTVEEG